MLMLAGEIESGDRHLVKAFPSGVLVAVVDGQGRGHEAAAAAKIAIATLEGHASESVISLVKRCHERLNVHDRPQQIADHILARFGKVTDDALVLVARYLGGAP